MDRWSSLPQSTHVEDRRNDPPLEDNFSDMFYEYVEMVRRQRREDAVRDKVMNLPAWHDTIAKYFGVVPDGWGTTSFGTREGRSPTANDKIVNLVNGPDVSGDRNGAKARYYLLRKELANQMGLKYGDPYMDEVMDVVMYDRYAKMHAAEGQAFDSGNEDEWNEYFDNPSKEFEPRMDVFPPPGFPDTVDSQGHNINSSDWYLQILKQGGM